MKIRFSYFLTGVLTACLVSCASTSTDEVKKSDKAAAPVISEVTNGYISNSIFSVTEKTIGSVSFVSATAESPVTVAPFYISQTELSYSQWYEVYTWAVSNGYSFANAGREGNDGVDGAAPKGTNKPVTYISWRDAVVWCNAASEKEGLEPVYLYNGKTLRNSEPESKMMIGSDGKKMSSNDGGAVAGEGKAENSTVREDADGYRLPTEKEWEFAARGGNPSGKEWTYFYSGSDDDLGLIAWYFENSDKSAHDVMTKKENSYKAYDMSGNVWEWCYDTWTEKSLSRVMRGGSYKQVKGKCSVTARDYAAVFGRYEDTGFRVARTLK